MDPQAGISTVTPAIQMTQKQPAILLLRLHSITQPLHITYIFQLVIENRTLKTPSLAVAGQYLASVRSSMMDWAYMTPRIAASQFPGPYRSPDRTLSLTLA